MIKLFISLITYALIFEIKSKSKQTNASSANLDLTQIENSKHNFINLKNSSNKTLNKLECQSYQFKIDDIFKPKQFCELLGHSQSVNTAVELQSGLLATGSSDYLIRIWQVKNNSANLLKTIKTSNIVISLSTLCSGLLAAGLSDGNILIYNTTDFSLVKNFIGHNGKVSKFIEDKPSEILFTASSDKYLRGWNITSNFSNLFEFQIDAFGIVSFIKMSYSSNVFAAGNQNGTICVLEFSENKFTVIESFEFYDWKPISGLIEFQEFGFLLASSFTGKIGLFDVQENYKLLFEADLKSQINSMVKLDSDFIACGLSDGSVVLLQINEKADLNIISSIRVNTNAINTVYKLSYGLILVLSEDKTAKILAFQELNCINYFDNKNKFYFYEMDFFPSLVTEINFKENKECNTECISGNYENGIKKFNKENYPSKTIFTLSSNNGEYSYFQESLVNYPKLKISNKHITAKKFIKYKDSIYLLLGLIDGTISFNYVKDYDQIIHYFYLPKIHKSLIYEINLFEESKLISCSEDGILIIWSIEDTSVPWIFYDNKGEEIYQCLGISLNEQAKLILIAGFSYVKVLKVENNELKLMKLLNDRIPKSPVYKLCLLKNNNILIMLEEKLIIYEIDFKIVKEISFENKRISAIKILLNDSHVIVGFEDGEAYFFKNILEDAKPNCIIKANNKSVVDFFEYIDGLLIINYSDFSISTINYFYFP